MSNEESNFITQKELDKLAKERRERVRPRQDFRVTRSHLNQGLISAVEYLHAHRRRLRQLKALQDQEQKDIAAVLNTSEAVAAEALALGIDAATAPVLPLIPLIEVAWADGKLTQAENDKVLEIAQANGVRSQPAIEFIELLLAKRPSQMFFDRINRVISAMIKEQGQSAGDSILEQAKAVAEASGGFFGLTNSVSSEEQELLDSLAKMFDID